MTGDCVEVFSLSFHFDGTYFFTLPFSGRLFAWQSIAYASMSYRTGFDMTWASSIMMY